MRYYDTLLETQRGPFNIIVDKTYEDLHPKDCFDDTCYEIDDMCQKIDRGDLDWFMLRTRVFFQGVELSSEYLGGCLYEDAKECLTDGTADDQIYQALLAAVDRAREYQQMFSNLDLNTVEESL